MEVNSFFDFTNRLGIEFYTGVPDSQLNPVCEYLREHFDTCSNKHVVAANEGGAVGLAAGHYLATGKPALVYMQNSGLGNTVNPICSLLSDRVYSIPCLFLVGWRGEPGVSDEPQHKFQGEITLNLLECLNIPYSILDKNSNSETLEKISFECQNYFEKGQSYAIVVKKGALSYETNCKPKKNNDLTRERVLDIVTKELDDGVFVCTTGKLSRELFEIRETRGEGHARDFLTVGSMGHSLMIAQGIALAKQDTRVFCLDGDGSLLMHMGGAAVTGITESKNLYHILINNGAHESVGGMPTAANNQKVSLTGIAKACGYKKAVSIKDETSLVKIINSMSKEEGPFFVEVLTNLSVRSDLGRPTTTPIENRDSFMKYIKGDA